MYENIISIIEKELQRIKESYNEFDYQECDPEGSSRASKGYKEYNAIYNELKQLKRIRMDGAK